MSTLVLVNMALRIREAGGTVVPKNPSLLLALVAIDSGVRVRIRN